MITLLEYAKTQQPTLRRGVVEVFIAESPVLLDLPFLSINTLLFQYNREHKLPGIQFRGIGEAYSGTPGVINPRVEHLCDIGTDIDVDVMVQETNGGGDDRRAGEVRMGTKAAALFFTDRFFNGDTSTADDAKGFDGLKVRLNTEGDQVIDGGAATLTFDLIDQLIDRVRGVPDALYMNKPTRRKMLSLARSTTSLTETRDELGRPLVTYGGVPVRVVEENNLDEQVLADGEIYACRMGDGLLSGLQARPLDAQDLGQIDEKPVYRTRISWYVSMALMHPRAAARLHNAALT